jgi:inhibitor of KinA
VDPPRIVPYGDGAFLVILGEGVDVGLNARVHRIVQRVRESCPTDEGWGHPVPSYASLLVPYDPDRLDPATAEDRLDSLVRAVADDDPLPSPADRVRSGATVDIAVRYGGVDGPDLDAVAVATGTSAEEVVRLHSGATYRVFLLGFSPGFPYLGPLAEALRVPRRSDVRTRVPAGSVAIAGDQTGIYPTEGPGGWHLIGRTDLKLWDPARDRPALLEPGQDVRFVPVTGD